MPKSGKGEVWAQGYENLAGLGGVWSPGHLRHPEEAGEVLQGD